MPHVALNWDAHRIRLVIAAGGKAAIGKVRFDRAETIVLNGSDGDESIHDLSPIQLADKLRAVLSRFGVTRGDATVVLSRSDVEIRELDLPPVPPEELPDVVRFQARNVFTSFTEDWLLDFVPISGTSVLAVAISGDRAKSIRETVEHAGLKLRHIVLRPFAAAELMRGEGTGNRCRVIVEPLWRQADISVVRNDFVVLTRTVRVPETYSDEQFDAWLPDEIKRTIAAASNQIDSRPVEEIVVCGGESMHQKLSKELSVSFDIPASFLDPFSAVATGSSFERPEQVDGYTSLLGSIIQTSGGGNYAVDFLAPRRPPQPQINKRKLAVIGGIAATLLLSGIIWLWWTMSSRSTEIARLQKENSETRAKVEELETLAKRIAKIDTWQSFNIDWLEELYQLSTMFPDPEDVRLSSISLDRQPNTANLSSKGLIRDQNQVDELIQKLHTGTYEKIDLSNSASKDTELTRSIDVNVQVPLLDVNRLGIPALLQPLPVADPLEVDDDSETTSVGQ